jgi:hypothetical protein
MGGGLGATRPTRHVVLVVDRVALVFAWPESGVPEAVITMSLLDRATVERAMMSICSAHHVDEPRRSGCAVAKSNPTRPVTLLVRRR